MLQCVAAYYFFPCVCMAINRSYTYFGIKLKLTCNWDYCGDFFKSKWNSSLDIPVHEPPLQLHCSSLIPRIRIKPIVFQSIKKLRQNQSGQRKGRLSLTCTCLCFKRVSYLLERVPSFAAASTPKRTCSDLNFLSNNILQKEKQRPDWYELFNSKKWSKPRTGSWSRKA